MRVDQIQAKIMTPRDIQFVINQQTKQLRTSDPFSDDYYYYNYAQVCCQLLYSVDDL